MACPDDDAPGRQYAQEVAASALKLGCSVSIVDTAAAREKVANGRSGLTLDGISPTRLLPAPTSPHCARRSPASRSRSTRRRLMCRFSPSL